MSNNKKEKKFTVVELFAGVGGFHLGLKESGWETIWANQWEPGKKEQHAFKCYVNHFSQKGSVNEDIAKVKNDIPEHDLLVGGFPCQDYSVAATNAKGIEGKKGVLWWEIYYVLKNRKPQFVLLENVDRLLRSPSKQRGRDFGLMLACLKILGYFVEWRMINAADYGFPQKRRRIFIFATRDKDLIKYLYGNKDMKDILLADGFFAQEFKVEMVDHGEMPPLSFDDLRSDEDLLSLSNDFEYHFHNAGVMINGNVFTNKVIATKEKQRTLGDILEPGPVDDIYYIPPKDIKNWRYCKGAKNEDRVTAKGFRYCYTEGAIPFPDKLNEPSRTMLTGEGNKRPNRITHVIKEPKNGKYRIITPVEAERLNGFPDNWTNTRMSQRWRYFCMGNALVVGLIERMGKRLKDIITKSRSASSHNKIHTYVQINKNVKHASELVGAR